MGPGCAGHLGVSGDTRGVGLVGGAVHVCSPLSWAMTSGAPKVPSCPHWGMGSERLLGPQGVPGG